MLISPPQRLSLHWDGYGEEKSTNPEQKLFTVPEESYKTCINSTGQGSGIVNLVEEFMHHIVFAKLVCLCACVYACVCLSEDTVTGGGNQRPLR